MNYVVGPNNGTALLLIPAQMGTWESYQHVREQLHKSQQEIREVTNGYTFRYPVDDSVLSLLTEFIDLEGRCCSFLNFTLDVKTERGPAWLTLTGPDGVKEFLRAEMSIDENLS